MESVKINGSVDFACDDFVIIKFPKGNLFFSESHTTYSNFNEILIMVDHKGEIKDVTSKHSILVHSTNTKGPEVKNYMLASLLLWSDYALKNYIYKILGKFI